MFSKKRCKSFEENSRDLECCKGTKRLCAPCYQKLVYVTKVTTTAFTFCGNDLKMSDLGTAYKCPFCRARVLIDEPKDFENGNEAIVKAMMLGPQETPKVVELSNGHTLCALDLKLKPIERDDDDDEKVGQVVFKFSPRKGRTSELKGCILFNDNPLSPLLICNFLNEEVP